MSKIDVWCAVEKFCKWCAMYSDGSRARVPSLAAISLMPPKLSKIVSGHSRRNTALREHANADRVESASLILTPCVSLYSFLLHRQASAIQYVFSAMR